MPTRIEMYDIAHLQGHHVRAAVVVWERGRVVGSRILRLPDGNDDPAQLSRALHARYARLQGQDALLATPPDLICLDGGTTQRSTVLREGPPLSIPLIALAKEHETIYGPAGRVDLAVDAPGARLLQMLRDRAHDRCNSAHRRARDRYADPLEGIAGVGVARRARLRAAYPTLRDLARASTTDLRALGLPARVAERVARFAQEHQGD